MFAVRGGAKRWSSVPDSGTSDGRSQLRSAGHFTPVRRSETSHSFRATASSFAWGNIFGGGDVAFQFIEAVWAVVAVGTASGEVAAKRVGTAPAAAE